MAEISAPVETILHLSPDEVTLLRAALRLLRATLGRDEAEELDEVKALLEKLDRCQRARTCPPSRRTLPCRAQEGVGSVGQWRARSRCLTTRLNRRSGAAARPTPGTAVDASLATPEHRADGMLSMSTLRWSQL